MLARELMTEPVTCCTPNTSLRDVARVMVEHDCGGVPVIESDMKPRIVGFVTDRDIACRAVAEGRNPLDLNARDVMSDHIWVAHPDTSEEELCRIMEEHQVRRVPVVDDQDNVVGIVAQADVARKAENEHETFEIVRDISVPARRI